MLVYQRVTDEFRGALFPNNPISARDAGRCESPMNLTANVDQQGELSIPSWYGGTPNWMVYNGQSYENEWFGKTPAT